MFHVLDDIRAVHAIPLGQIAMHCGYGPSALSQMRSRETQQPSRAWVSALRANFGVNPDWINTGRGEMYLADWKSPEAVASAGSPVDSGAADRKVMEYLVDRVRSLERKLEQQVGVSLPRKIAERWVVLTDEDRAAVLRLVETLAEARTPAAAAAEAKESRPAPAPARHRRAISR